MKDNAVSPSMLYVLWIVCTTIVLPVGLLFGYAFFVLSGLTIGLSQVIVLRRTRDVRWPWMWVLASFMSWGILGRGLIAESNAIVVWVLIAIVIQQLGISVLFRNRRGYSLLWSVYNITGIAAVFLLSGVLMLGDASDDLITIIRIAGVGFVWSIVTGVFIAGWQSGVGSRGTA